VEAFYFIGDISTERSEQIDQMDNGFLLSFPDPKYFGATLMELRKYRAKWISGKRNSVGDN